MAERLKRPLLQRDEKMGANIYKTPCCFILEKNLSFWIKKRYNKVNYPLYRIADVSEIVGFTDVAHFSRVFKKMEGISANEFRNTRI